MRVGTHDSGFHADEVFAIAVLREIYGDVEVIRTRDAKVLAECAMRIDVGARHDPSSGDYDHHQRGGAGERADSGIRYASFGLIWQALGVELCAGQEAVAEAVDRAFVQAIDAHDNGQRTFDVVLDGVVPTTVSQAIGALNASWDESADSAKGKFDVALDVAGTLLRGQITQARSRLEAVVTVRTAITASKDERVIELPRSLPWHETVLDEAPRALFVIYPQPDGTWTLQGVPDALGSFTTRLPLPESWAGRSGEQLAQASGVGDAVFCHVGRFLAVARSREGVLTLARSAQGT